MPSSPREVSALWVLQGSAYSRNSQGARNLNGSTTCPLSAQQAEADTAPHSHCAACTPLPRPYRDGTTTHGTTACPRWPGRTPSCQLHRGPLCCLSPPAAPHKATSEEPEAAASFTVTSGRLEGLEPALPGHGSVGSLFSVDFHTVECPGMNARSGFLSPTP